MDTILQADFARVEAALATLVDSIATYNPSPQAAVDLIAADEELGRGLDSLAQHQANYTRIQTLRAEAEALESQLKTSVSALASLRRELFETPATTFPKDSRPVPFDELLQYAKNISQYTVPPTYRERVPVTRPELAPGDDGGSSGAVSNGIGTPAQAGAAALATSQPTSNEAGAEDTQGQPSNNITEEEGEWLKKLNESRMAWYPWPDNDKVRRGNLMQIQHLLDTGKDPTEVDIPGLAGEEKLQLDLAREKNEAAADAGRLAAEVAPAHVERPVAVEAHQPVPTQQYSGFDDFDDD